MSAYDIIRSFAEANSADDEPIRYGITYGVARQVVADIKRLIEQCNMLNRLKNGLSEDNLSLRDRVTELEAERDRLQQEQRTMLIECGKLTAERDQLRDLRAELGNEWERLVWSLGKASEVLGALETMDGPDDDSRWRIWAGRYIRSIIGALKAGCAALNQQEGGENE